MTSEHISDALDMLDDKIIEKADAVRSQSRPKHKSWARWGVVAACLCVVIIAGTLIYFRIPAIKDINSLLASIERSGEFETAAFFDYVIIGNRVAEYEQVYAGTSRNIETPVSDESTSILTDYVGELYQDNAIQIRGGVACKWYCPIGSDNLKYLIKESEDGRLSLWIFRSFMVTGFADEEFIEEEKAFYDERFPGANLSAYTYGEVYRLIYGVNSVDDIISITTSPSKANNTDFGKQLQKEVGTHTYTSPDDIRTFYESTVELLCYGKSDWQAYYKRDYRFAYSFSTNETDKLTSGEETLATRNITVTLTDGTTIDSWKYDALRGCFYEYGGIFSEPLSESVVADLNAIFGIE